MKATSNAFTFSWRKAAWLAALAALIVLLFFLLPLLFHLWDRAITFFTGLFPQSNWPWRNSLWLR